MQEDHREYERLIAPLESRILKTIWSVTRNAEDAEEALQEALTILWRRWDRVCRHSNPEALIFRMCINASYDVIRRNARYRRNAAAALTGGVSWTRWFLRAPSTPVDAAQCREQETAISEAIARLSRNQAIAVVMRLLQDQPFEDVAEAIGCRTATARKHLERGRDRLRILLAPVCARTILAPAKEETLK
ncbi:MAG: RNA polymerase sigma factor [Candidatus Hydrogenedentes bacterium]|nr:RNA polymerase sigma factor [Candidatus Hydrogenedentota bacterium]